MAGVVGLALLPGGGRSEWSAGGALFILGRGAGNEGVARAECGWWEWRQPKFCAHIPRVACSAVELLEEGLSDDAGPV